MMTTGLQTTPTPTPAVTAAATNASQASTGALGQDTTADKGFAGMLDDAGPTAVPAEAAPAPQPEPARVEVATDEDAAATLPEQLLAMLGGAFLQPPTEAAPATPDTTTATGVAAALPASTTPVLPVVIGTPVLVAQTGPLAAMPATTAPVATLPVGAQIAAPVAAPAAATVLANVAPDVARAAPAATQVAAAPIPLAELAGMRAVSADAHQAMSFDAALRAAVEPARADTTSAGTSGIEGLTGDVSPFGALLPTSATSSTSPSVRALPVLDAVQLPANPEAGFDDAFGSRISWMADQKITHAEIRVNPENVGPIDVRLQIDGTRVSADFSSTNAEVRQALESSMGRLRDMLGQQGLELAHSGVGQGQRDGSGAPGQQAGDGTGDGSDAGAKPVAGVVTRRGLLDEYA